MFQKIQRVGWAICVFLCGVLVAQAQQTMMSPPKVLVITREALKPGKYAVHEKWEAGWPRAFGKASWPVHYIAASSLTGEPRVLFMTGYESLAAWEKDNDNIAKNAGLAAEFAMLSEKDGDFLSEQKTAVFSYMPELSYHPEVSIAGTRYFGIFVVHVKPGHNEHFEAVRKTAAEAHAKANLGDHYAVFHCVTGSSAGLYLVFIPMKSLAELDQFSIVHGKAYQEALGEEGRKAIADFAMQGQESSELQLFAFSPKMSYVGKDWVDADPAFWAPKPAAAKPMEKKEPAKK